MPARRLRVDITGRSILRILVAAALVWTWLRLWQWVLLFVIAAFITVGLDPIVGWLDARRVRRRYGSVLVVVTVAVLLGSLWAFAVGKAWQVRHKPAEVTPERIAGAVGEVRRDGLVYVEGELWQARTSGGERLQPGQRVRVESLDGLVVTVKPEGT